MLKKVLKFTLSLILFVLVTVAAINLHRTWDRYNPIDYWLVKYG